MTDKDLERPQKFRTFRLLPEDKALLQNLKQGRPEIPDRYTALLELDRILDEMEIPKKPERKALRVGIPIHLKIKIEGIAKKTGRTFQEVLLLACHEYRNRYPVPDSDESSN